MVVTRKQYLGDGVYVDVSGPLIVLTTENGYAITNSIYLEPETVGALMKYLKSMKEMGVL